MAIKSHRQTKLRDQCVLLRFYCENAKKSSELWAEGKPHAARGEQAGRLCRATANMTASGKRFIIYLSAEIGTEATRKERERESEVGQTQLLRLVAGVVWHVSLSNARVATRVVLLTCQVNAIFMCPERAGHLNPPPEDRFIICPNLKLCHTSVI